MLVRAMRRVSAVALCITVLASSLAFAVACGFTRQGDDPDAGGAPLSIDGAPVDTGGDLSITLPPPDDGAAGDDAGGECAVLSECCDSLQGPNVSSCQMTVASGLPTACSSFLMAAMDNGQCLDIEDDGGGSDGGSTPPGDDAGQACQELAACCSTLGSMPAQQNVCTEDVTEDDESVCASFLSELQEAFGDCKAGSGSGSGGPDAGHVGGRDSSTPPSGDAGGVAACEELAMCCPNLPATDQPDCNQCVASGSASECASCLSDIEPTGLCKGDAAEP
jgi:hypothetical protein